MFLVTPLRNIMTDVGAGVMFLGDVIHTARKHPCDRKTFMEQIWQVTMQSLPTTAMAGFFVGAIMSLQFIAQVKSFGALGLLGGLATSATIREVGPLLIAFMLSGKVGAYTSAELGTMRVTEQIDAIRCLGTNPIQYLVLPRFFAILIASFFLLAAGLMMSILGGVTLAAAVGNINPLEYIREIPRMVTIGSVIGGLFKCLVFALLLATICTYKGYTTTGGSKGVGKAVIMTAVSTMVGIVMADWATTRIIQAIVVIFGA